MERKFAVIKKPKSGRPPIKPDPAEGPDISPPPELWERINAALGEQPEAPAPKKE